MGGTAPDLLEERVQFWTDGTNAWLEIASENGSNERVAVSLEDLERLQVRIADMVAHLKQGGRMAELKGAERDRARERGE